MSIKRTSSLKWNLAEGLLVHLSSLPSLYLNLLPHHLQLTRVLVPNPEKGAPLIRIMLSTHELIPPHLPLNPSISMRKWGGIWLWPLILLMQLIWWLGLKTRTNITKCLPTSVNFSFLPFLFLLVRQLSLRIYKLAWNFKIYVSQRKI